MRHVVGEAAGTFAQRGLERLAGEAEHGTDAGEVLEAHAVREVGALALELIEHGAEVQLASPGGSRLTAHPRS